MRKRVLPHRITQRELEGIAKAMILKLRALLLLFLRLVSSFGVISAQAGGIAARNGRGEAPQYRRTER